MRQWLIGSALLLLFASALHATIFGGVRGTVRDRNGAPLAAAQVTLRDVASSRTRSTNTDSQGVFRFAAVPIGIYRVAAIGKHVTSPEVTLNVVSGTMTNVAITAIPA